MTTIPWNRIDEVFADAVERSPGDREAYLDKVAAQEPAVAAEVRSLLQHAESADEDFLRPPSPSTLEADELDGASDPLIGKTVGAFTITGVIARGGMGTVYTAEQSNPQRTVALKIMRAGLTSSYVLRHFEREARILAKLSHPNIAQVHAAGTFRDAATGNLPLPYFALEYIADAQTITEFADAQSLSLNDRLRLFLDICAAVHHGHQRGVIHRDLKPGNLLVDGDGRVKVIDFGVARTTDADIAATTMQTNVQQLVGTLPYMSPEQCGGDPLELDTRSDVYSLGVVLYELVCGQLPYELPRTSVQAMTRAVCECLPTPPSTVFRSCRRDLEAIILKALEKNRDERYQSAAELGADLKRYLTGEPVDARAPGWMTRMLRRVRRHPILTTAVTCVGLAVIVLAATLVSLWFANQRPHHVEIVDDEKSVRLLSIAGATLDEINLEGEGIILYAEIVRRPEELGGGRLILVGFGYRVSGRYAGRLCAFDASDGFDTLVWESRIEKSDMPADTAQSPMPTRHAFGVSDGLLADIFPDSPGCEIVASYQHMYSRYCLRVYNLSGEVLYQTWHDGPFGNPEWLSKPGILVLHGDDSRIYWKDLGYPELGESKPWVVGALRPVKGWISNDYFRTEAGDGPDSAAWYHYLLPPELMHLEPTIKITPAKPPFDARSHFSLEVSFPIGEHPAFVWTLDSKGEIVPDGLILGDVYLAHKDKLPHPNEFSLGPLPEKRTPDSGADSDTPPEDSGQFDSEVGE